MELGRIFQVFYTCMVLGMQCKINNFKIILTTNFNNFNNFKITEVARENLNFTKMMSGDKILVIFCI
jgi:hypothetical protein